MNWNGYKSESSINGWHKITYKLNDFKWLQVRIQHQYMIQDHIHPKWIEMVTSQHTASIPHQFHRWQSEQSMRAAKDITHHVLVEGFRGTRPQMLGMFYTLRRRCFCVLRTPPLRSVAVFTATCGRRRWQYFRHPSVFPGEPFEPSSTDGYGMVKPTSWP